MIAIVRAQCEALAVGDFEQARTFASRELQRQFTTETFAVMVSRGYPALVRGSNLNFGKATDNGAAGFIDVRVTDMDGTSTSFFRYALVRERAGWRIAGVVPIELPGVTV